MAGSRGGRGRPSGRSPGKARGNSPEPPILGEWIRYYCGGALQFAGLFILTGTMALFFGAENMERRMLAATGGASVLFVAGWLLSRKPPRGARPEGG